MDFAGFAASAAGLADFVGGIVLAFEGAALGTALGAALGAALAAGFAAGLAAIFGATFAAGLDGAGFLLKGFTGALGAFLASAPAIFLAGFFTGKSLFVPDRLGRDRLQCVAGESSGERKRPAF